VLDDDGRTRTLSRPEKTSTDVRADALPARADIGLTLLPLKAIVNSKELPAALVTAVVHAAAGQVTVTAAADKAAALYVYVTTAQRGTFTENGFHLLRGESRVLTFSPWGEAPDGKFDPGLFASSLHVHWLNQGLPH
jgi:hypothetical protein